MEPELLQILQHTLGLDQYGQGRMYRNHFVGDTGGDPACERLVALGFMASNKRLSGTDIAGGGSVYHVTEAGKEAVGKFSPKPPKLTPGQRRYREWIEVADCFPDWKFGDWLKHRKELEQQRQQHGW